jgi:SAM-dependent methyltransferase
MNIEYIGKELDYFKEAINWKNYFSDKIIKYIKGDVLEVGAGIGINTNFFTKNNKRLSSITCLEPDKKLCEKIITNNHNNLHKINEIITGTIEDIDKKYDTIIYIDVLEHIEKSKKEIELIKCRLKKDGCLIILVPAYNYLFSEFDKNIGHFRRYNKAMLNEEIDNQLELKKIFYLDSMGFFASLVNKIFLKKSTLSINNIKFWDNFLIKISKISDKLFFHQFGKSLIGVYQKIESER